MSQFYKPSSRLAKKRLKEAYRKSALAIIVSIILIVGVLYLGIPVLVKLSTLLGNFRSSFEPVTTTDTTPPFPPRLEPVSEATNSSEISVKGFSEPGSTLELFINGETYKKVLTPVDGSFEIDVTLKEGENRILAQATDNAKNISHPSETLFVTYQKKGPKLEISEPRENTEFKNERTINVQGITDPEASVTVNDRYVIIDQEGFFSFPYSLIDGENTLKIMATDQAGNEITREIKVKYSP